MISKTPLIALMVSLTIPSMADSFSAGKVLENDDGSISIMRPVFQQSGQGMDLKISAAESNLNGVCKAYGLGRSIHVESEIDREKDYAVVNSKGLFDRKVTRKDLKIHASMLSVITEIVCTIDSQSRLSRTSIRYEKVIESGFGVVRIVRPTYGQVGGKIRAISGLSNLSGVCRLYGFDQLHSEAAVISKSRKIKESILLSRDGRFSGFEVKDNSYIETIACQGELLYRMNPNFHPSGISQTLNGIAYAAKPIVAIYLRDVVKNLDTLAPIADNPTKILKDKSNLGVAESLRLLQLELLKPLFDSMNSAWFMEVIKPALDEQVTSIHAKYGYRNASEMQVQTMDKSVELLVYQIVSLVDVMSKEVHSVEAAKWLTGLKSKAGKVLASATKTAALNEFAAEWTNGAAYLDEIRANRMLEGLISSLDLASEILSGLK